MEAVCVFVCADSHTCLMINDPLTCVWASGLWWVITHDPLEWKGIYLSPVRMNAMMNAAARCYLDSPEVRAVTNYPHTESEGRAAFTPSDQQHQPVLGLGLLWIYNGNTPLCWHLPVYTQSAQHRPSPCCSWARQGMMKLNLICKSQGFIFDLYDKLYF